MQSGVSIRAVAELLRHTDIRATMRYAQLAPETIRAPVSVLEAKSRFGHGVSNERREEEGKSLI